jgi:hypothetical protein
MLLEILKKRSDALSEGNFLDASRLSIEISRLLDKEHDFFEYDDPDNLRLILNSINNYQKYKDSIPVRDILRVGGLYEVVLDAILPISWNFYSDMLIINSALIDECEFTRFLSGIGQERFIFVNLTCDRDGEGIVSEVDIEDVLNRVGVMIPDRLAFLLDSDDPNSAAFERNIIDGISRLRALRNTIRRFEETWLDNIIDAVPYYRDALCVSQLRKVFEDREVLVVSPGPSLMECGDHLKGRFRNFLTVAVAQSVPALKSLGLTPDYVMVVDPADYSNVLTGLDFESCKGLIAYEAIHKNFFCANFKNVFLISPPSSPIRNFELIKGSSVVLAGSSVSVQACSLAIALGARTVGLIGQDLCLQNGSQYGAESSDKKSLGNGVIIRDDLGALYLKSTLNGTVRRLHTVSGQNGETLLSPSDYCMYRAELERLAAVAVKKSNVRLLNFSQGGAQIDGFENLLIQEYACLPVESRGVELQIFNGYLEELNVFVDTCIESNTNFLRSYPEIYSDQVLLLDAFLSIPSIRSFGKSKLVDFFSSFDQSVSEVSLRENVAMLDNAMNEALMAHSLFFQRIKSKIYSLK